VAGVAQEKNGRSGFHLCCGAIHLLNLTAFETPPPKSSGGRGRCVRNFAEWLRGSIESQN